MVLEYFLADFCCYNDKKKERIHKTPLSNAVKKIEQNQLSFLSPTLREQLNSKQELYLLSEGSPNYQSLGFRLLQMIMNNHTSTFEIFL